MGEMRVIRVRDGKGENQGREGKGVGEEIGAGAFWG